LAQLALTLLVTWFIVSRVGLSVAELRALESGSWTPRVLPLAASIVALAAGYVVSAAIWARIVEDLGGPRLPLRNSVPVYMVANLGRYIPGKLWQIAGLAALSARLGVPMAVSTAAAVVGQAAALLAATSVGALALLSAPDPYPTWGGLALGAIVVLLALGAVPAVYRSALGAWFRIARAERPEALSKPRGFQWFAGYVVNWALYAGAFWLLTRAFGLAGPPLAIASAFAAAYVLGYLLLFAPAGLGPREGFLILFLSPYFGPGPAGMIAIVARVWTTVVEVLPAAAFWTLGSWKRGLDER